jgi:hypothetical protein
MFQGGVSEPGSSLSHDFVIENAGASPLTIESVVPGCGCTVASYDSFIAPGRTGKVTVTLDLYREWAGQEYLKVVTVISNDPENPRMRLAMKGRVGMGMNPPVSEPGVPPSGPDASPGQPGDLKAPPVPDAPAGPEAPAAPASPAGPSGSPGQGGQS